jgi:hypothetical protein
VLLLETGGARATSLPDLPAATLKQALALAAGHLGRLVVKEWNGAPVLDSPVAPILEQLGFRREALVYLWS